MKRVILGSVLTAVALAGCDNDEVLVVTDPPPAPRALAATYYAGVVTVSWELAPGWDGEAFRIYSRRVTDSDFFFIAEVTSCSAGQCTYEDVNVVAGETYEYLVSAVDPNSGVETDSDASVTVFVPSPTPPPVPDAPTAVALDDAVFVTWGNGSRGAGDFSHYRVYLDEGGSSFLLGETDSEGFLDLLAANGLTYAYFLTAVDTDGHESEGSVIATGTPRPDFHGEVIFALSDKPEEAGFRFAEDESTFPILDGNDPIRHFGLEVDASGWWLVPGPEASVFPAGFETTALKCGVAADTGCLDVQTAPTSGYVTSAVEMLTQTSFVLRVIGDDAAVHYGVIRVELLGFDQNDDALMIFDWAYQLQPGNPDLVESIGG